MHLNQIKINGFKSFSEDIDLVLEPGVTAVVGPNGCGKSNVSDAIRWVLGEQSARALRCTNMQDLLFNGGADFKPAQKAKVSLHFTNTDGRLALESPEIEIARQLTREGESRYLINNNPCLLRDINELFMDTGIGVSAYSMMEQSKIDLILNTRAEERRFLFDEVAGITKYKHRKKTALKKLEDTEQNLVRINDVIHEAQRETEKLQRQAAQAQRHQQLHEELRSIELNQKRREYERIVEDLIEEQVSLDNLLAEIDELNSTIQSAEQESEGLIERRAQLDTDIEEGNRFTAQFSSKIEQIERDIALHKQSQMNLHEQRQRAILAIESYEKQLAEFDTEKRELHQERSQLDATLKLEESRLTARQRVLNDFATRIAETKQTISQTEAELSEKANQASQLESEVVTLNNRLEFASHNLDRVLGNVEEVQRKLESVEEAQAEVQKQEQQLKATLVHLDTEKRRIEEERQARRDSLRKLESEMRGLQDSLGMNASRLKSLKDLQSTYEGFYTGVRAIMMAKEDNPETFGGVCGVVAELIRTNSDYELAVEVALGGAIQNVVTETAEDAKKGIRFLKETRAGRVTFLPLDMLRARSFRDESLLNQKGVIGLASDLVEYAPKYDIAIRQLLGNTVVIKDLDTAIQLSQRFRPNSRLVTVEGEIINTFGAVTGGSSASQTAGFLSRPRELEDLQTKIDDLKSTIGEKETNQKKHVAKLAELERTYESLASQQQESEIRYAGHVKDLDQHNRNILQFKQELEGVQSESSRFQEEADKAKESSENSQTELDEILKIRNKLQNRIKRFSEQVQSESNKHEEVMVSCQELEVTLASRREQISGIDARLEASEKNQARVRADMSEHQKIIDSDDEIRQSLSQKIDEAQKQFLLVEQEKAEAEEKVNLLMEERDALRDRDAVLQKSMRTARRQGERHNKLRHQKEVTVTQLEMQQKAISAGITEKYQVAIEQVQATEEAINEIELLDQVESLKAQIADIGAVNMKAIDEYEAHRKREEFLVRQREDLETSLDSTYKGIQKIDQTSREAFQEAFEKIRANFREVFTELFEGGEAELDLTDDSDILESGIDIIACPPGKRPQSITQLSGGERSLVAIALLFAIFKLKPSPFCILDEVDAALDE
ncbi:MAG: chromosome segregation protein SMC, partial [Candidatus Poribacteria bacterium]|nr:chromosome segregation protein SMC [Candidatus Poribacteria bacterium]